MSLDITLYYPVVTDDPDDYKHEVWERNITHNLGELASALGVYEIIWRPDETNGVIAKAHDMIWSLVVAIEILTNENSNFRKHEPENGWGTIDGFIRFMREYLAACRKYPNALIEVSR
jgi:hypothetical protein